MKRNHIFFKCAYLFLVFYLFLIGYRTVENSTVTISEEQEGIEIGTGQSKSIIEQILEEAGCPVKPEKEGVIIERAKELEIPDDSELENWKVYEFNEDKNGKKETAEKTGKILLETYFPKAEKTITDYGDYGKYQLDYKDEEVFFHFKFLLGWGTEITFMHRSQKSEIEEPEDGDWEMAYLQQDKELLQQLELGLWNGEQGYLEQVQQQQPQNYSRHIYKYRIDSKEVTNIDFNFIYNMMPYTTCTYPVTFEYEKGVLTGIEINRNYNELETIREAEIKYTSMEEILQETEKKIKRTCLLDWSVEDPKYWYFCIEGIQLYYMKYCYGELEKKYAFVPVAEIELMEYSYDLKTKKWSMSSTFYYGLQLETGEGSIGGKY